MESKLGQLMCKEVIKHASNILNVNIHSRLRVLFTPENQDNISLTTIHDLCWTNYLKMFQMRAVWKIFAAQLKPKYKIQTWTSSDPRITSTYDQHPQISMCSNFPHRAVRNKSFSSDTITKTRKDINYDKIYDKIRPRYIEKSSAARFLTLWSWISWRESFFALPSYVPYPWLSKENMTIKYLARCRSISLSFWFSLCLQKHNEHRVERESFHCHCDECWTSGCHRCVQCSFYK